MFTRIMVPLDGSPRAEGAIPVAAKIAKASTSGGAVILTRVQTIPMQYAPVAAPGMVPPLNVEAMEAERREFATYLSDLASSVSALANLPTEILVLTGSPARCILEEVSTNRADLIVMTSHGRTGVSRWLLGSVAEQIAHHAPVPVLIVREQSQALAGQPVDVEHLTRVLVPLDGSSLAEAALEPAARLAAAITSAPALHLVLVVSPYEAIEANMPEALAVASAKGYLGKIADHLKTEHSKLSVTWSVGVGLDIAETIIRIAEGGDDTEGAGVFGGCDVVAIATHGHTGFVRWALGSITERVLHGTKLPLLIVRPPKVATAARSAVAQPHESQETVESDSLTWTALF